MMPLNRKSHRSNLRWCHLVTALRAQMLPPESFWPNWRRLPTGLLGIVALNYVAITWLHCWGWPYLAPATTAFGLASMPFWCRGRPIDGLVVGTAASFGAVAVIAPEALLASIPLITLSVVSFAVAWSYDLRKWRQSESLADSGRAAEDGSEDHRA